MLALLGMRVRLALGEGYLTEDAHRETMGLGGTMANGDLSATTLEYDIYDALARRGGGEETAASSAATLRDEPSARTLRWFPTPDSARTLPGWSAATLGVLEMVAEPPTSWRDAPSPRPCCARASPRSTGCRGSCRC